LFKVANDCDNTTESSVGFRVELDVVIVHADASLKEGSELEKELGRNSAVRGLAAHFFIVCLNHRPVLLSLVTLHKIKERKGRKTEIIK
jgi:hypothetical protein